MTGRLAHITLVVDDYDRAIAYYTGALGFDLIEDTKLSETKRFVRVAPPGGGCGLLLAKAKNDLESSRIGNQTGGRVAFFLHVDDFDAAYAAYQAAGVDFTESPRDEPYGRVVVFRDLHGNLWDLVEPKP